MDSEIIKWRIEVCDKQHVMEWLYCRLRLRQLHRTIVGHSGCSWLQGVCCISIRLIKRYKNSASFVSDIGVARILNPQTWIGTMAHLKMHPDIRLDRPRWTIGEEVQASLIVPEYIAMVCVDAQNHGNLLFHRKFRWVNECLPLCHGFSIVVLAQTLMHMDSYLIDSACNSVLHLSNTWSVVYAEDVTWRFSIAWACMSVRFKASQNVWPR